MDKISIEVLEDGTIKTTTDQVSMPNHQNAENFLREMGRLCGGIVKRIRRQDVQHTHVHTHDGQTHSH